MTDEWRRLTVRLGADEDVPYEDIPRHLEGALESWLKGVAGHATRDELVAVALKLRHPSEGSVQLMNNLLRATFLNDLLRLELVDAFVRWIAYPVDSEQLRERLKDAGSVWTVSSDCDALVRMVEPEMQSTYDAASAPSDPVSEELKTAWSHAFGIHPNESDAWDHAIKAVEHALASDVIPGDSLPTLGKIIGQLKSNPHWRSWVHGKNDDDSIGTALSMLEAIWGNSDRHGGPAGRPVRDGEGRSVVCVAATVVQLWRTGTFVVKVP